MYQLKIYQDVYEELNDAVLYYDAQQIGLGTKLLDDWDKTLKLLQKNPLGYEIKYKVFRQIQLQTFPYFIVFMLDKSEIIVTCFIHAKRKPARRYSKLKK